MGWVKDRQNTQKPKTEKKNKREQNTPSKAEQLQCAFRFAARPGLQAHGFQKQCFLSPCFYEDFGSIWGTLWGTILVKNR